MNHFDSITLNKKNGQHLYIQLYNNIKDLIKSGSIKSQSKLPPIRKLANILEVNNVTVVSAYKLLEREGYVYKKVGSGTFVKDMNTRDIQNIVINEDVSSIGDNPNEYKKQGNLNNVINFASTAPTPNLFPVNDFKQVINEVLDRDGGNAFVYQESQGYYPLRASIHQYLEGYNIKSNINDIQIISGAQQGIDILTKSLVDYGDIVFTESPTYTGAIAAFKSREAKIIEIPIKEDGIDIISLENKLKNFRPKFIYVMPNFQNPTGYTYSKEKKERILKLAKEYNTYIIEDDYLSDLKFNDNKSYTLKSIDEEDRVIYIKSFSKIFMPGLRLAFMIIPKAIYTDVLSAKHTSDIFTSGLIQRAFDIYLRKGIWKKHIINMETLYKKRLEKMTESLKKHLPKNVKWGKPNGGLNFWISLPNGYSSNELYKLCSKNGIIFVPGSLFYVDQKDNQHFRLSIASIDWDEIDLSVKKLSNLIRQFLEDSNEGQIPMDVYTPFL
ncbi:PLP-dependent aminotransferase family protein [Dethiothermospora halolimnae]|uniref:MocR-like pyridoxine biosynthesis transcription factor PdxR n=1 Tax=Dethiothermospora halolimnae TaxID=3114390 RepID=UPI003CCC0DF7